MITFTIKLSPEQFRALADAIDSYSVILGRKATTEETIEFMSKNLNNGKQQSQEKFSPSFGHFSLN